MYAPPRMEHLSEKGDVEMANTNEDHTLECDDASWEEVRHDMLLDAVAAPSSIGVVSLMSGEDKFGEDEVFADEEQGETDALITASTFGRRMLDEIGVITGTSAKQVNMPSLHPYSIMFRRSKVILMWLTLTSAAAICCGVYVLVYKLLDATPDPSRPSVRLGSILVTLFAMPYHQDAMEAFLACFLYLSTIGLALSTLLCLTRQYVVAKFTCVVVGGCILLGLAVAALSHNSPYSLFGHRQCDNEHEKARTAAESVPAAKHATGTVEPWLCVNIVSAQDTRWSTSALYTSFEGNIDAVQVLFNRATSPERIDVHTLEAMQNAVAPCVNSTAPYALTIFGDIKPPADFGKWIRARTKVADFSSITWTRPRFNLWQNILRVSALWCALAVLVAFMCVCQIFLRMKMNRYAAYYACILAFVVAAVFILLLSSFAPSESMSQGSIVRECDSTSSKPLATLYDMEKYRHSARGNSAVTTQPDVLKSTCDPIATPDGFVYKNSFSWIEGQCKCMWCDDLGDEERKSPVMQREK